MVRPGEIRLTKGTGMWFFPSVREQMAFQIAVPIEPLGTHVTLKWLTFRVNDAMFFQIMSP